MSLLERHPPCPRQVGGILGTQAHHGQMVLHAAHQPQGQGDSGLVTHFSMHLLQSRETVRPASVQRVPFPDEEVIIKVLEFLEKALWHAAEVACNKCFPQPLTVEEDICASSTTDSRGVYPFLGHREVDEYTCPSQPLMVEGDNPQPLMVEKSNCAGSMSACLAVPCRAAACKLRLPKKGSNASIHMPPMTQAEEMLQLHAPTSLAM